jgi:hypothetical protein
MNLQDVQAMLRVVSRFSLLASRFSLVATCFLLPAFSLAQPRPAFDAGRLKTGLFLYRTLMHGKEAGLSRVRIRKTEADTFSFTNVVEGVFSQSWEALATRQLAPISARLVTGSGKDARTVFELSYRGGRVAGFAISTREPGRKAIDEAVTADTVDQRIDWAAVMSVKELAPGSRFAFHVYDPGTGHSRVAAIVLGPETIVVPAGSFEITRIEYTIGKRRGPETYVVFVRSDPPRFLVKETFPNGAETELTGRREPEAPSGK